MKKIALILIILLALSVSAFATDVAPVVDPADQGVQFTPAIGGDIVYLVRANTFASALSATVATYQDWAELKYQYIIPQEKADVEPIGNYHGVALAVKLKNSLEKAGLVWAAGLLNPSLTAGIAVPVSMDLQKYDFTVGISFINYRF